MAMDSEQIVRLTAAVLWELHHPRIDGDTLDAMMLRIADAVGIALATEAAPCVSPRERRPDRGPRGTSETRELWVKDYPATLATASAPSPTQSSFQDTAGGRHEA